MRSKFLWTVPITLLLLSFFSLPYGYYTLLRIVVAGSAGYLAWLDYSTHNSMSLLSGVMFFLAILFNPICPIYLPRAIWSFIDVICALIFITHGIIVYARESKINLKDGI